MLLLPGPEWALRDIDWTRPSHVALQKDPAAVWARPRFAVNGVPLFVATADDDDDDSVPALDTSLEHTTRTSESVWDGSLVLAKLLERQCAAGSCPSLGVRLAGSRAIELGAGRGIAGMAAAALGANVVLTDIDPAIPPLERIVAINGLAAGAVAHGHIAGCIERVAPLDWTASDAHLAALRPPLFDLVLAADVVWVQDLIVPLVETLSELVHPNAVALLAHQSRSSRGDNTLFDSLARAGLAAEAVDRSLLDPAFAKPGITVYRISRPKE
nr:hypothetical protein HK105_006043 [Polyrhizophydium stewartii]